MLKPGKCYYRNDGKLVEIGGRIRDYSSEMPYVWSTDGFWYDEESGAHVGLSESRGRFLWPLDNWRSVFQHRVIKEEKADEA